MDTYSSSFSELLSAYLRLSGVLRGASGLVLELPKNISDQLIVGEGFQGKVFCMKALSLAVDEQ